MPSTHPYHAAVRAAAKAVHPEPSAAQREAGNFQQGHVWLHGLNITIETAAGQIRRKVGKDGKAWSRKMHAHYGYIRGTEDLSADADHVDVFVGPHPQSQLVFVVDQLKADGSFDEAKCIVGTTHAAEAKELYLKHYPANWTGFGGLRAFFIQDFKKWLAKGGPKRRASVKRACDQVLKEAAESKKPSGPHPLLKLIGMTAGGVGTGTAAGIGVKQLQQAVDYHPEALQALNEARSRIDAASDDPLRNLTDYVVGGHKALTAPVYGNTTGLDIIQHTRSVPAAIRQRVPGLERGWEDPLVRAHYENTAKSPAKGLQYLIQEAVSPLGHGADRSLMPAVSSARQNALQDTMRDLRFSSGDNSLESFQSRYTDNFLNHFRALVKPTTGNPVSDEYVDNTGRHLLSTLEQKLPEGHRLVDLWNKHKPVPRGDGSTTNWPVAEQTLDLARAHADPAIIRQASGYPNGSRPIWPTTTVQRRIGDADAGAQADSAEGAGDAIHAALKDDPVVQQSAAAANMYFGTPGAMNAYNLLGHIVGAPGEAVNFAEQHAHHLPWAAGAGAGLYGLARLMRRYMGAKSKASPRQY